MDNMLTIMEPSGDHYGSFFVVERVLYDEQSEFQRVFVFESKSLGRVLMLDNIFNVSTKMEAYYHEPMAHLPVAMLEKAEHILLIGGGDFGIAKHLLKHKHVQKVTMCELDPKVMEACRKHFPEWADVEQDPRFDLQVGDGCAYIQQCANESLDAVIVDSTDPIIHAPMLISEDFYKDVYRVLKPGGNVTQIIADHMLYPEAWETVYPRVTKVFDDTRPFFLPIPFYATGAWGLMMAVKGSEKLDISRCSDEFLGKIDNLQTMSSTGVQGWFALPPQLKDFFSKIIG